MLGYGKYKNIMARIDMNKNIVTRNFQHKNFVNEINVSDMLHYFSMYSSEVLRKENQPQDLHVFHTL